MGSRNIKTIKGKQYLYYIISKNGKKKALYCGLASKSESKKKAIIFEIECLKSQKQILIQRIKTLEYKLNTS